MVIATRSRGLKNVVPPPDVPQVNEMQLQHSEIKTTELVQCIRAFYVTLNLSRSTDVIIKAVENAKGISLTKQQKKLVPVLITCYDEDLLHSNDTRTDILREALKSVRLIQIPNFKGKRTAGTRKEFVNNFVVYVAYLIVSPNGGQGITTRFEITDASEKELVAEEIEKSSFPYSNKKEGFMYNAYMDAHEHVKNKSFIGPWIANVKNKYKKHGSWSYNEGTQEIVGDAQGLYQPYKSLLEEVGVKFD